MRAAIVASHQYERQATKLLTPSERSALEQHLSEAPEAHPIIPGTGGVRKARWGRGGWGKSGGVRAIYYFQLEKSTVYMLTVYAKAHKADLTEKERQELKKLVKFLQGRSTQ